MSEQEKSGQVMGAQTEDPLLNRKASKLLPRDGYLDPDRDDDHCGPLDPPHLHRCNLKKQPSVYNV